jgi:hypothetical protein
VFHSIERAAVSNLYKFFALGIAVGIILFLLPALASSSRGGVLSAGEGLGSISGWNVSNVRYLHSSDPAQIMGVEFDLDGPAKQAAVALNSSNPLFYDCTNTNYFHWRCVLSPAIAISSVNELRVVAVNR